mmetsp:Transcript_2486/g.7392  ORF Transcript_2486/g.7392 Transcript_2486/m.7392 type:complete len:393 (-) Transcript_2486:268-1446(-)
MLQEGRSQADGQEGRGAAEQGSEAGREGAGREGRLRREEALESPAAGPAPDAGLAARDQAPLRHLREEAAQERLEARSPLGQQVRRGPQRERQRDRQRERLRERGPGRELGPRGPRGPRRGLRRPAACQHPVRREAALGHDHPVRVHLAGVADLLRRPRPGLRGKPAVPAGREEVQRAREPEPPVAGARRRPRGSALRGRRPRREGTAGRVPHETSGRARDPLRGLARGDRPRCRPRGPGGLRGGHGDGRHRSREGVGRQALRPAQGPRRSALAEGRRPEGPDDRSAEEGPGGHVRRAAAAARAEPPRVRRECAGGPPRLGPHCPDARRLQEDARPQVRQLPRGMAAGLGRRPQRHRDEQGVLRLLPPAGPPAGASALEGDRRQPARSGHAP